MHSDTNNMAVPCLRGVIGNWVYYSSLMTAEQISKTVSTVKEIREAATLDEVLQRKLKDRKRDIAKYIQNRDSRFFNSIILGVFDGVPKWIEFNLGEAFQSELTPREINDIEESMGVMKFTGNESIFAIDGQHRVEGIKIAFKDNPERLKDDQFSVLFIAHIDDEQGQKRTRRLFSDINTNAKAVSKGDRIIIDEDDISAIVARRLYSNYAHFKRGETHLISLSEQSNLDQSDRVSFTNLITLHTVNHSHLKKLFIPEDGVDLIDEVNVDKFYLLAKDFYDFIIENITDYYRFFVAKDLNLETARNNNSNLLFRPVGLILVARIYVFLIKNNFDPVEVFSRMKKLSFTFPGSVLEYILWTKGKMEVSAKNQKLALDIVLYVLGIIEPSKELLERYREVTKDPDNVLPNRV